MTSPIIANPKPQVANSCKYNLEEEFKGLDCSNENYYSKECNKFLLKKEFMEQSCIAETPNADTFLYPSLSDKNFNIKIATKKEFNDTKYDGEIHTNIKEYADELQAFEGFLSFSDWGFANEYSTVNIYTPAGKCYTKIFYREGRKVVTK